MNVLVRVDVKVRFWWKFNFDCGVGGVLQAVDRFHHRLVFQSTTASWYFGRLSLLIDISKSIQRFYGSSFLYELTTKWLVNESFKYFYIVLYNTLTSLSRHVFKIIYFIFKPNTFTYNKTPTPISVVSSLAIQRNINQGISIIRCSCQTCCMLRATYYFGSLHFQIVDIKYLDLAYMLGASKGVWNTNCILGSITSGRINNIQEIYSLMLTRVFGLYLKNHIKVCLCHNLLFRPNYKLL